MTDKEYLDKALTLICELYSTEDYICEQLHRIPEEYIFCANNCSNFNKSCILRYLKYYKNESRDIGNIGVS